MRPRVEVVEAANAPWAPQVGGWQPRWAWRVQVGMAEVTGLRDGLKRDAQAAARSAATRLKAIYANGSPKWHRFSLVK